PASEQKAASALLASSEPARALLRREAWLDGELSGQAPLELNGAFARKLAEIPLRNPQRSWSLFRRWLWAPALGWSIAAALGLFLGASFSDADEATSGATESAQVAPDDPLDALALGDFTEWEETAP
ncbi:MAG TPA: hypothetical protein VFQ35_16495, partial [Polyangiaceae bacterium]|nr:hypothetical protein [Polyangiaceae bacterium]